MVESIVYIFFLFCETYQDLVNMVSRYHWFYLSAMVPNFLYPKSLRIKGNQWISLQKKAYMRIQKIYRSPKDYLRISWKNIDLGLRTFFFFSPSISGLKCGKRQTSRYNAFLTLGLSGTECAVRCTFANCSVLCGHLEFIPGIVAELKYWWNWLCGVRGVCCIHLMLPSTPQQTPLSSSWQHFFLVLVLLLSPLFSF